MNKIFCKQNIRILVLAFVSILITGLFVFLVDFDLIKSVYELYYGKSEVATFFKEQGENVFTHSVRTTTFKLIIFRFIYSMIPLAIGMFLLFLYHCKKLPDKILKSKIFDANPSLGKILNIARYLLGFGLFFIVINYGRAYFSSTFHNCILGNEVDFIRVALSVILFLIPVLEWKKLWEDLKTFPKRHKKLTNLAFVFLISIISFCLVEFQIGSKTSVLVYLIHINIMYWILLQLVFLVLFRNVKPGAFISLIFSYVIGLANDIVYQFRGNYIMFGDITVVRTALEVAGNYEYHPNKWFWISAVLLLCSILFVIFVKIPKKAFVSSGIHKRVISTILVEGLFVILVIFTFRTGDFYGHVFGVGWDYNENVTGVGYLPYFFSNMDSTTRIVVEGYSSVEVDNILGKYSGEASDSSSIDDVNSSSDDKIEQGGAQNSSVQKTNIILIQNEAFSDLAITKDIETDQDYMPFIHSLKENTQKGFLNMSITGGPTSNTEFEVLTRSSLQYFPYGSVPYTQYLKQNIPSLTETLNNQTNDYHTFAYHSYYSSGYNRNSVYDYIGFDEKAFENSFLEDYPKSDLPRGYLSDEANYKRVISMYESNKASDNPFFCFNVTIQGHGGYTGGPFDLKENVKVTNFEATDSINTYLSCVKMSDAAFKGLVEYFEKVDEPTIIFMYGDHQPSWDDPAQELLDAHPAWEDESMQRLSEYYVPYIIWANYDIEEFDNMGQWSGDVGKKLPKQDIKLNVLSTNYVGSTLLRLAGAELSDYDRFLLDLHEDYPAITAIGIWDKNGNYYVDAESVPDTEKLEELRKIQYNLIFDKEDKKTERFLP